MADERPFMPPPPRELRDLPPRPPQPQTPVEPKVEEKVEPAVEEVSVVEPSSVEVKQAEVKPEKPAETSAPVKKEKKERQFKKRNLKPLYWLGFIVSVAAAVGLIILFLLKKQ